MATRLHRSTVAAGRTPVADDYNGAVHTHVTSTGADTPVPRAGMLATVRNRRGVVAAVEPFDGETGRLHLVHLEYADNHTPAEERLLWEREPQRHLLEPNALPDPAHSSGAMPAEDFDALLRAARWTALSPYLDPAGGDGRAPHEPVASPFHGSVRIENYQLVPLLKALRMPRVSLNTVALTVTPLYPALIAEIRGDKCPEQKPFCQAARGCRTI
ncbi:MAG: hypothetical protein OXG04_10765 [Acidobacteria bacterium]|nr:hypothetical protein [Acidobacteriota bacterium]